MNEIFGLSGRGQIGAPFPRSGEPGWGLLLLVLFAGNVFISTVAWTLVSLLLK
jgi:hypothetical protein